MKTANKIFIVATTELFQGKKLIYSAMEFNKMAGNDNYIAIRCESGNTFADVFTTEASAKKAAKQYTKDYIGYSNKMCEVRDITDCINTINFRSKYTTGFCSNVKEAIENISYKESIK